MKLIIFTQDFFSCVWNWSLNSRLYTCEADTLQFEVTPPVHFALVILEMGSHEVFAPRLTLNCGLPDLSLPARTTGMSHQHPATQDIF
jgi:hypothetical protein